MTLSLLKLAEVGAARYVAADPAIVSQIRGFEKGPESQLSAQQDKLLRAVVKAAVTDPKKERQVTDALVLSGNAGSIVEAMETNERALDRYGKYLPVLQEYGFDKAASEFGERMTVTQPESIAEMASRIKSAVGNKGKIIWPEALGIAQKYYGKSTFDGTVKTHTVFPFVSGSNGNCFFGPEGQESSLVGKQFDGKPLVVADYGATLITLSLDLMNQGFPDASVEWKVSRGYIHGTKPIDQCSQEEKAARLGALYRDDDGVFADSSFGNARHDVFVGASLESQK